MSRAFQIERGALDQLLASDLGWLRRVGNIVRDEARRNVPENLKGFRAPNADQAIISVVEVDDEGPHADIGYARHHPGFYLWWHEVGTTDSRPQPHLRPALRPGLID